MNVKILALLSLFTTCGASFGQDEVYKPATIISKLADGTPPKPAPPLELPEFRIHWETQQVQNGRLVTIKEVETPILVGDEVVTDELIDRQPRELRESSEKDLHEYFFVSTTVFDNRRTLVKWYSLGEGEKKSFECFSNLNWNHLGGFSSFEARGKKFTFMLMPGSGNLKELRKLKRQGSKIEVPQIPKKFPEA